MFNLGDDDEEEETEVIEETTNPPSGPNRPSLKVNDDFSITSNSLFL